MAKPNFTRWLLKQQHRDDPVGDLARDVANDPVWPAEDNLRAYIDHVGEYAEDALRQAWREWTESVEAKMIPFSDWILTQAHRDDWAGVLARDALKIPGWPKGAGWEEVHDFDERNREVYYLRGIDIAWFAYRAEMWGRA